jgi:hypothetical protein
MKRTITKLSAIPWRMALLILVLIGYSNQKLNAQTSFSPWCDHYNYHYWTATPPATTGWYIGIAQVQIVQAGTAIFDKPNNGATYDASQVNWIGNYGAVINTPSTAITLEAGGAYTLRVSLTCGNANYYNAGSWGSWIDYNNNKTYDASEYLNGSGATTATMPYTPANEPGPLSSINFSIPCSAVEGLTRLRIACAITGYANQVAPGTGCNNSTTTYLYRYGETEDYYVNIRRSGTLSADFVVPPTIYVNSPVTFVNVNQRGYVSHEWDKGNNGTYNFTGTNYSTTFTSGGTNYLKLRSTNCLGRDSVIKAINVLVPTQAPDVDFISNRTMVEDGDDIILYDLSDRGPTSWQWYLSDKTGADPFGQFDQDNFDGIPMPPLFMRHIQRHTMYDMGLFDLELCATNVAGTDCKTKQEYINVVPFSEFRLGAGANSTELGKGTIFDRGGPNNPYVTGNNGDPSVQRLRIQPCGAEKITLTFTQFKLGSAAHNLKVWDGPSAVTGVPMHPVGGFTKGNTVQPLILVALSGAVYMELDTRSAGAVDSGLIGTFVTEYGPTGPPIPSFQMMNYNQAYTGAPTKFKSNSFNIYGMAGYSWTVDGMPVPSFLVTDEGRQMQYSFPAAGDYDVCLDISSCTGDSFYCETITVIDPSTQTELDFVADKRRPGVNDPVKLTAITDKANRWRWQITPFDYTPFPLPTMNNQEINVEFTKPGVYTVSLRAWNTMDSAATTRFVVKDKYIVVVNYCEPVASIVSEDISNNYVEIRDVNNNLVYSRNTSGNVAYESFLSNNDEEIKLNVGATYTLKMRRNTNADPVSRAAYIDFNINGVFENYDRVLHHTSSNSLEYSSTFTVPSVKLDSTILGIGRLRTVVSYANGSTAACGPILAGKFEDFKVRFVNEGMAPVITLIGMDTVRIEQGSGNYVDDGAVAMSQIEGDISHKMVISTDVEPDQPGIYFYRYDVTDAAGNPAIPVIRWIYVTIDQTAPVMTMWGNDPDTIDVYTPYNDPGVTSMDNVDGNITSGVVVSGTVDHTKLGSYVLIYTSKDNQGNESVMTRTVVVVDRVAPEINFVGSEKVQLGSFWMDQTFVTDNYWSVNSISFTKVYGFNGQVKWDTKGSYPVTYKAIDGSGNMTEVTRVYIVDDFIAPVISLNTADTVIHDVRTPYYRVDVTVTDNYYSDEQLSLQMTLNTVDPDVLGKYEERYRAVDGSQNVTEKSRFVKVVDRKSPQISAPPICTKWAVEYNPMTGWIIEDNYYSYEELLPLMETRYSDVNVYKLGTYKTAYSVTDPSGNTSNIFWRDVEVSEYCAVVTSIDEISLEKAVSLYPNPTTGTFNIAYASLRGEVSKIEILNAIGQRVHILEGQEVPKEDAMIDLSSEPAGIFLVRVTSNGNTVTKRVVVTR